MGYLYLVIAILTGPEGLYVKAFSRGLKRGDFDYGMQRPSFKFVARLRV